MSPNVETPRYAQQSQHAVEIELINGRRFACVGVFKVDEVENAVKITNPRVFGDSTSFRWITSSDITSASVLSVEHPTEQNDN